MIIMIVLDVMKVVTTQLCFCLFVCLFLVMMFCAALLSFPSFFCVQLKGHHCSDGNILSRVLTCSEAGSKGNNQLALQNLAGQLVAGGNTVTFNLLKNQHQHSPDNEQRQQYQWERNSGDKRLLCSQGSEGQIEAKLSTSKRDTARNCQNQWRRKPSTILPPQVFVQPWKIQHTNMYTVLTFTYSLVRRETTKIDKLFLTINHIMAHKNQVNCLQQLLILLDLFDLDHTWNMDSTFV